jgi:lantibiotic leader peptide-processing serine protease
MARPSVLSAARIATGILVVLAACSPDQSTGPDRISNGQRISAAAMTPVSGRYIVLTKPGKEAAITAATASLGSQLEKSYPVAGMALIQNPSAAQISTLKKNVNILSVVQDVSIQWIPTPQQMGMTPQELSTPGPVPNGTDQSGAFFFNTYQWNLKVTQANAAWLATPGGLGEMVCVLDTGVDPGQLDLIGKVNLTVSTSMVAAEPFIEDLNFHGTFVSGLISGRGIGMASTAPDAQLCAVKVLGASGSGSFGDVINGILYAAAIHADVINMSLGAYVDRTAPGVPALLDALTRAIKIANDAKTLVVTSSGNSAINLDEDAPNLAEVPAQLRGVISVGATAPINQQNFDLLASYSNYGGRTGISMVAPGGDFAVGNVVDLILSACSRFVTFTNCTSGASYLFGSGTSFASPMVAGAGAVVESQLGAGQTTATLTNCLILNADNVGPSKIFGHGRLNVLKAAACQFN